MNEWCCIINKKNTFILLFEFTMIICIFILGYYLKHMSSCTCKNSSVWLYIVYSVCYSWSGEANIEISRAGAGVTLLPVPVSVLPDSREASSYSSCGGAGIECWNLRFPYIACFVGQCFSYSASCNICMPVLLLLWLILCFWHLVNFIFIA